MLVSVLLHYNRCSTSSTDSSPVFSRRCSSSTRRIDDAHCGGLPGGCTINSHSKMPQEFVNMNRVPESQQAPYHSCHLSTLSTPSCRCQLELVETSPGPCQLLMCFLYLRQSSSPADIQPPKSVLHLVGFIQAADIQ